MNFYTADLHLSHAKIIPLCERPFADVAEMNQRIISNILSRVTRKDDLYVLGDVAAAKGEERARVRAMLLRVPARLHLILGNHDKKRNSWVRTELPWTSVQDYTEIRDGERRVSLFHYPMVTWPGIRSGAIQLFGHVHQNWSGQRNSVNVGVDHWDFRPVTLAEILPRAAAQPISDILTACEPGLDSHI